MRPPEAGGGRPEAGGRPAEAGARPAEGGGARPAEGTAGRPTEPGGGRPAEPVTTRPAEPGGGRPAEGGARPAEPGAGTGRPAEPGGSRAPEGNPARPSEAVGSRPEAGGRPSEPGGSRSDAGGRTPEGGARPAEGTAGRPAEPGTGTETGTGRPAESAPRDPEVVKQDLNRAADRMDKDIEGAYIERKIFENSYDADGLKRARKIEEDLTQRRQILDDMMNQDAGGLSRYTPDDIRLATGELKAPTPEQVARGIGINQAHGGEWAAMTKKLRAKPPGISKYDMYLAGQARKAEADAMLKEAIAEIRAERNGAEMKTTAFGSTNLTSDYDISVGGPGSEAVVERFNRKFRAKYGKESGTVFDTNVYTDPIYTILGPDSTKLFAQKPELADTMRQFTYDQMATRKYMSDKAWAEHCESLVKGAPDEMKPMVQNVLDAAERADRGGKVLQSKEVERLAKELGLDPKAADTALRAQNEVYGRVLGGVDEFRRELDRIGGLASAGGESGSAMREAFQSKYATPAYRETLAKLEDAVKRSDAAAVKRLQGEAEGWLAHQLRNRQGFALYHASEAYQTEGAIAHVVGELQAQGKKVTYESLTRPGTGKLRPDQYLNSLYENRANMFKELEHIRDATGKLKDPEKAAEKAAKYFIRQLDAAHETGIDVAKILGDDLVKNTALLDAARADRGAWAEAMAGLRNGSSPEKFVEQVEAASHRLSGEALGKSGLKDLAPEFNAMRAKRTAPAPSLRIPDPPSLPELKPTGLRPAERLRRAA